LGEPASRSTDEEAGRNTAVMIFSPRFGGRYFTLALAGLPHITLVAAVIERSAVDPLSLIALLSLGLALKNVTVSWTDYANEARMLRIRRNAFLIHLVICTVIALSSLGTFLR
jgi:1,4-dihydroxy-2-naphthoate octaprenyltransferase